VVWTVIISCITFTDRFLSISIYFLQNLSSGSQCTKRIIFDEYILYQLSPSLKDSSLVKDSKVNFSSKKGGSSLLGDSVVNSIPGSFSLQELDVVELVVLQSNNKLVNLKLVYVHNEISTFPYHVTCLVLPLSTFYMDRTHQELRNCVSSCNFSGFGWTYYDDLAVCFCVRQKSAQIYKF